MTRGFVYRAAVLDWHTRRVLAWRLSIAMESSFCVEAVEEALEKYGAREVFYSPGEGRGQGSQFTSEAFTTVLLDRGIAISMDGRGAQAATMSSSGVRRGKAAFSSGCKSHPANAPAGSNRSRHGGDEMSEAFG